MTMLGCCATYDTLEKVNGFLLLWKITKLNYFADKIASDLMTQTHLLYALQVYSPESLESTAAMSSMT